MTVLRARADLSGKQVYCCTISLYIFAVIGRYSLQLDNKNTCNLHMYLDGVALYSFDYQTYVVVSYEAMQIMGITPVFWLHFTEEISTVCTCCNNLEHIA